MPLNLASPGIVVREVDLTTGRVTPASNKTGALVAAFPKGPVESPTLVENENDLLNIFGRSYSIDNHYETWLVCSSYLSYGGSMRIIRADDDGLTNGFVPTSVGAASSVKINSQEDYDLLGYDENTLAGVVVAAKNPGSWSNGVRVAIIDSKADQTLTGIETSNITVGMGITQGFPANTTLPGVGSTSILTGVIKGIITGIGNSTLDVKVLSHIPTGGSEITVDYQPKGIYQFRKSESFSIFNSSGNKPNDVTSPQTSSGVVLDWFDQQSVGLTTVSSIKWNNISPRPGTSAFAEARNSRFDEVHVVVIDYYGSVTGNAGTILEKHLSLSKAKDSVFSTGSPSYWRKYLSNNSDYIFGLNSPTGIVTTGFDSGYVQASDTSWDQDVSGIIFGASGNFQNNMVGGKNYSGKTNITTTGALSADINELSNGYDLFESTENFKVDFLLMGSAAYAKEDAQALANKIISVAELRKDALAFISPYRGASLVDNPTQGSIVVNSSADITDNLISFYSPITSSSYAVFDSGYKYMYDRFENIFRYVPLNGDIAGICARNDINNFPWYSPAGTARGSILNAVKLAYNPTKSQRDVLYSNRINPVIFSPGAGIVLFGDKTGYGKASAFDRINVRRLFIYLEDTISKAAKDTLFEFNDEITRSNFVNTIEPFLRDVQAKRGIFDYVVVCDETNNTASVIDSNEFIADIYIKPARSINYIGLNFIATKTGVDFEEVIGNF